MNPYSNGGNQNNAYLPYGQQQQQYMTNLPAEMQSVVNGFPSQKIDGNASNASGSPQQQPASFDPSLMASLIAKRQMYGQPAQPQQQQQQQAFSPTNSSMGGSPAISSLQSPRQQSPMMNNNVNSIGQMQQQNYRTPNISNTNMSTPTLNNTPNLNNMTTLNNTPNLNTSAQQQQWSKQQQQIAQMQRMDDQQRQQFMLMQQQQQQQMRKQQFQQMQQQLQQTPILPTATMSPMSEQQSLPINGLDIMAEPKRLSPVNNIPSTIVTHTAVAGGPVADLNTKRVEVILALNIELIRLCIESQNTGVSLEPNLGIYQSRLQSNLTYLATMADISMVEPGKEYKAPSPPDLKPLPAPKSEIGKKIHEILSIAQGLFNERKESPSGNLNLQQQMMRQQAAAMRQQQQQQFLKSASPTSVTTPVSTPTTPRNMMTLDPQAMMLRQAQQAQAQNLMQQQQQLRQQQMMMGLNNTNNGYSQIDATSSPAANTIPQQISPNDLLAANGMMNPSNMMMNPNNIMNNMYNNPNDDPNNYNNVMMMMQRLQQQQNQNQ